MSRRLALLLALLVIPITALALWQARNAARQQASPRVERPRLAEPVADLQARLDAGEVQLELHEDRGYIDSVLQLLDIPKSSQTLVFSKSSAQLFLISPETPRAIYFNDDVYVGYVVYGGFLEFASMDPATGPVFYTLDQQLQEKPQFKNEQQNCLACHDTFTSDEPVPRLLMLSVLPDPTGVALNRFSLVTNDASPFPERWGGWYVTGTHGKQRHLGNTLIRTPANAIPEMRAHIRTMDLSSGANLTDLGKRFDPALYQTGHSDIVALMVLGHQTHVHNLITDAVHNVKADSGPEVLKEYGEPIVEAMLFSEAAALTDPIAGTSDFTKEFTARGPKDSQGRSLRDFDLKTRLFRYPMSYLVYSKSFDAMPGYLKEYVFRRMRQVLSGEEQSPEYSHLTAADRAVLAEILKETKPEVWAQQQ